MGHPVMKFQSGKISLAAWATEYKGELSYNYTLSKGYKNKEGEWKDGHVFTITDFHDIVALATLLLQRNIKDKSMPQMPQAKPFPPLRTPEEITPTKKEDDFDGLPF